jgi:hypothetical protein
MQRKVLRRTNGKVRRPPFNFLYYCKKNGGYGLLESDEGAGTIGTDFSPFKKFSDFSYKLLIFLSVLIANKT